LFFLLKIYFIFIYLQMKIIYKKYNSRLVKKKNICGHESYNELSWTTIFYVRVQMHCDLDPLHLKKWNNHETCCICIGSELNIRYHYFDPIGNVCHWIFTWEKCSVVRCCAPMVDDCMLLKWVDSSSLNNAVFCWFVWWIGRSFTSNSRLSYLMTEILFNIKQTRQNPNQSIKDFFN
jgi:hypothetical protein